MERVAWQSWSKLVAVLGLSFLLGPWSPRASAFMAFTRPASRGGYRTGGRSVKCGLAWLDQQAGPSNAPGEGGTVPNLMGSKSVGLDWGHKKIGIAVSAGFSERPVGTIPNPGGLSSNATLHRPTLDRILTIAKLEGANRLVIGHPLYRNGTMSPQAKTTQEFARLLANRAVEVGLLRDPSAPFVYLWDERLTSQAARLNIKIKATTFKSPDVDSQAACLILEDFYRSRGVGSAVVRADAPEAQEEEEQQAEEEDEEEDEEEEDQRPPAGQSPASPGPASYRDWIEAERQRYGGGGEEEEGGGRAAGKKTKKKKRRST